jgi:hypothetical protein
MRTLTVALSVAAVAVLLGDTTPARASTTCGRPELLDTSPPDMATNVPPNASFFAHYDASAEYGNEIMIFTPEGGVDEGFTVGDMSNALTWDSTQGLLIFKPPSALSPGNYKIVWPALRGLNTASPSLPATVSFTVGATEDVSPPDFAGLTGVTWDLERQTNDCTGSLENRMVFTLSLAPASDDGGRAGLTLVVFQSSGSGVDASAGAVQVLSTPMPVPGAADAGTTADAGTPVDMGTTVTVKLSVADATGHVCFAALVRDLTGKISNSGSQTVCVDTTAPPFFRGCAFAARDGRGGGPGAVAFVLFGLAAVARRRRAA